MSNKTIDEYEKELNLIKEELEKANIETKKYDWGGERENILKAVEIILSVQETMANSILELQNRVCEIEIEVKGEK